MTAEHVQEQEEGREQDSDDEEFDFELFSGGPSVYESEEPFVKVRRREVFTISQNALSALGNPEWVQLFYDRRRRVIAFRAAQKEDEKAYKVRNDASGHRGDVAASAFFRRYDINPGDVTVICPARMWRDRLVIDAPAEAAETETATAAQAAM